jgi:osmotically-inducible protein OsmY
MTRGLCRRVVAPSVAAIALTLGLTLGATPAQAGPSDAWITTKAKAALLTTEGVSGTAINVDTADG